MSISIPDVNLDLTLGGGVSLNYVAPITINPLHFGIDPIEIKPLHFGIDPIEIKPIDFSIRIKEVPSVRVWFPVDYRVAFGLFGVELACVHLCGQSQVITEPYVANPCECKGG